MRLESLLPLALAALASADQTCRVCLVDDCFEAIASSGRADCSVYLAADPKLTLPTITTTTSASTTTPVDSGVTITVIPSLRRRGDLGTLPAYATACTAENQYSSACACLIGSPTSGPFSTVSSSTSSTETSIVPTTSTTSSSTSMTTTTTSSASSCVAAATITLVGVAETGDMCLSDCQQFGFEYGSVSQDSGNSIACNCYNCIPTSSSTTATITTTTTTAATTTDVTSTTTTAAATTCAVAGTITLSNGESADDDQCSYECYDAGYAYGEVGQSDGVMTTCNCYSCGPTTTTSTTTEMTSSVTTTSTTTTTTSVAAPTVPSLFYLYIIENGQILYGSEATEGSAKDGNIAFYEHGDNLRGDIFSLSNGNLYFPEYSAYEMYDPEGIDSSSRTFTFGYGSQISCSIDPATSVLTCYQSDNMAYLVLCGELLALTASDDPAAVGCSAVTVFVADASSNSVTTTTTSTTDATSTTSDSTTTTTSITTTTTTSSAAITTTTASAVCPNGGHRLPNITAIGCQVVCIATTGESNTPYYIDSNGNCCCEY